MIFTLATKNGHILRYTWEGQEKRDYSLDLKRIPFCTDQQVLKAVPLSDKGVYVSKIAYSLCRTTRPPWHNNSIPLIGFGNWNIQTQNAYLHVILMTSFAIKEKNNINQIFY